MNHRLRFSPWMLPLLGLVVGYVYAYAFFHGLLELWHPIGKPEENIGQILGVKDARNLLVATETGAIYSFRFAGTGQATISLPLLWNREDHDSSEPVVPIAYHGADFYTLPPLFHVVQLWEMEYIYKVEGKGAVKFALDTNGNLWMWNHQIAGLTGLVIYYYPAIGFLAGLFAAVFVTAIRWRRAQERSRSVFTHF